MAIVTPDLRLPSQSQDMTALQLAPSYTVGDRGMCVNNLPKVVTWQQNGWEFNVSSCKPMP